MDRVDYQSLVIQDIINLENRAELDLAPWYQRRSIWNPSQKAYLINTILENKPIPAIYVRHSIDLDKGKSIKEVVDGQQRTRTIISYANNEFAALHPTLNRKVRFEGLNRAQQQDFLLTAIPVGYLLGATDSDVIDIFGRINSISKSLNAQEKRNARWSGDFKQFCLREASKRVPFWKDYGIFTSTNIARMDEVQFISDLAINMLEGLADFSPKKIDTYYSRFDADFPESNDLTERFDRVFDTLISINSKAISETIFNRQPVFFSLFLVLDSIQAINLKRLEDRLFTMDAVFNADLVEMKSAEDLAFIDAVKSTTQRLAQRRTRDQFIRNYLM